MPIASRIKSGTTSTNKFPSTTASSSGWSSSSDPSWCSAACITRCRFSNDFVSPLGKGQFSKAGEFHIDWVTGYRQPDSRRSSGRPMPLQLTPESFGVVPEELWLRN
jgi:hypothetical protein